MAIHMHQSFVSIITLPNPTSFPHTCEERLEEVPAIDGTDGHRKGSARIRQRLRHAE